jgi:hypothetical protein
MNWNKRLRDVVLETNAKIPWTARRTNVSILQELSITVRLSSVRLERILKYFGHVARRGEESLEKLILVGKTAGTRPRGRSSLRSIAPMSIWTPKPVKSEKVQTA